MSGFCIFYANFLEQTFIQNILENYSEEHEIEGDILRDNIEDFNILDNGTISFNYIWDKRFPLSYRNEIRFGIVTSSLNVRAFPFNDYLFYLVEKKREEDIRYVKEKISRMLYGGQFIIRKIPLTSECIKEIELRDAREIRGEAFEKLSDRDNSMMLSGALEIQEEDGTTTNSELHQMYKDKPKHYSQNISRSYSGRVYLSNKKSSNSSVSILKAELNTVESYIKDNILPILRLED